jgi:hypothetical protein
VKYWILIAVTALTTGFAVRTWLPRTVKLEHTVPKIVTVYDTVPTLPVWYKDSLRHWKERKSTTDTVSLYFTTTLVDTQFVPVNAPPENRPDVWPLLDYHGGSKFGDTAVVSTYSLRTGNMAIRKVFVPGILTGIDAYHEGDPAPRLNFAPFPKCPGPSFLYSLKMMGIGGGLVAIGAKVF